MKKSSLHLIGVLLVLMLVSLACRLTTATPASWSGTPTAEARKATNDAINATQQAAIGEEVPLLTPTATEVVATTTPRPTVAVDGPWLVFPAPDDPGLLLAYDVDAGVTLEISLPAPIYTSDLINGLSPDGHTLIVRAGSPLNTDEFALYQIDLPSTTVTKLTPLLSLVVQRKIVNEEGTRAFDTLRAVTREDGLAWSPDGRYLAFTAALNVTSSDLYLWDSTTGSIERLNGLYSHSASPFWSPSGNWLITQELGDYTEETGWRSEVVTGVSVPGFDNQNSLYLPSPGSQGEVFIGWLNAQTMMSYSQTADGPFELRQVNVDSLAESVLLGGAFRLAALDPNAPSYAFILDESQAVEKNMLSGVYLVAAGSAVRSLQMVGDWSGLYAEPNDLFIAVGVKGLIGFSANGSGFSLSDERMASVSPSGNWMVAWGTEEGGESGARLYQSTRGTILQTLTDLPVRDVVWQPDSMAFYLTTEDSIYRMAFPQLSLEFIAGGFDPENLPVITWVE
ncbi:PD40 domain-containing protein [Chloroflexota bacterium]|nr:PD40 domain-containing protein [Chloroflexota bacterium]